MWTFSTENEVVWIQGSLFKDVLRKKKTTNQSQTTITNKQQLVCYQASLQHQLGVRRETRWANEKRQGQKKLCSVVVVSLKHIQVAFPFPQTIKESGNVLLQATSLGCQKHSLN